jgi:leucine dehydrogenase
MEFVKLLQGARREDLRHRHQQGAGERAVDEFGAEAVGLDEIYDVRRRRVLAVRAGRHRQRGHPARLKAKVICGAANNQLATTRSATRSRSAASSTRRTTRSTPAA